MTKRLKVVKLCLAMGSATGVTACGESSTVALEVSIDQGAIELAENSEECYALANRSTG